MIRSCCQLSTKFWFESSAWSFGSSTKLKLNQLLIQCLMSTKKWESTTVNPVSCQQTADNQVLLLIVKSTISVMKYNNVEKNTCFCLTQTVFAQSTCEFTLKRYSVCVVSLSFFFWWRVSRLLKVEVDVPLYTSNTFAHSILQNHHAPWWNPRKQYMFCWFVHRPESFRPDVSGGRNLTVCDTLGGLAGWSS